MPSGPIVQSAIDAARRVDAAITACGEHAQLIGYDVIGIQSLVFSNRRPKGIKGASSLIRQFDEQFQNTNTSILPKGVQWIFSGGGRGFFLAESESIAEQLCKSIRTSFSEKTISGTAIAAAVPFEKKNEAGSIARLFQALDAAKETATPYAGEYPAGRGDECEGCGRWRGIKQKGPEGDDEWVCVACKHLIREGQDQRGTSLVDVAGDEGLIAVVSADGNGFGVFFKDLDSLKALAAASIAVSLIFSDAHNAALASLKDRQIQYVDPVYGGDDIKLLIPPSALIPYVGVLVNNIVEGIKAAANLNGLLSASQEQKFQVLGVGIGAIIADPVFPATRLIEYAQALEDRAKASALNSNVPLRSSFDLEWLISYDGDAGIKSEHQDSPYLPVDPASEKWEQLLTAARALSEVPSSQLTLIAQRDQYSEAEFFNLLRYQVARNQTWKRYYSARQLDWTNADHLLQGCPDHRLLTVAKVLSRFPQKTSRSAGPQQEAQA